MSSAGIIKLYLFYSLSLRDYYDSSAWLGMASVVRESGIAGRMCGTASALVNSTVTHAGK